MAIPEVSELMAHLHENIDSLHTTLSSLSDTSTHDAAITKLEAEREARLHSLTQKHEAELKYLADLRKTVQKKIQADREKEEEAIRERRRKEDEERRLRIRKEEEERTKEVKEADERMERERAEKEKVLVGDVDAAIEKLEDEMERKVEEGRKRVGELDAKRKEINKKIDEMLNAPTMFPQIQFRRRSKEGQGKSVTPAPNRLTNGHAQPEIQAPAVPPRNLETIQNSKAIPPAGKSIPDPTANNLTNISSPTSLPDSGPAGLVALLGSQNGTVSDALEQSKTIPIPGTMAHSLDSPKGIEVVSPAIRHMNPGEWLKSIGRELKEINGEGREVVEDPEDTKVREEITRLNAEMMAAAADEKEEYGEGRALPRAIPEVPEESTQEVNAPKSITLFRAAQEKEESRKDPMLSRLWNGEIYIAHKFLASPRPCDPMINRLWSNEKYMPYIHTIPRSDPMLDRLWNGKCERRQDPMLDRLWNGETYTARRSFHGSRQNDPMLDRLWSNEKYMPYIYTIPRSDPMLDRLFCDKVYFSSFEIKFNLEFAKEVRERDPMIERLWRDEIYAPHRYFEGGQREDPMMDRLWNGESYRAETRDPMIERLWSNEIYAAHPLFQGPKRGDRMLERLWNGEKYMPYIHVLPKDDPMLQRLWNRERHTAQSEVVEQRRDPMITRLWSAIRYREDVMLDRLWNRDSYLIENHSLVSKPDEKTTSQSFKDSRERPLDKQSEVSRDDPMIKRLWWDEKYDFSIKREPSVIEREITSTSSEASDHHPDMPSASFNKSHFLQNGARDQIPSPITVIHDENPFEDPISESDSDSFEYDAPSRPPMSTFFSAVSHQSQRSPTSRSESEIHDYPTPQEEALAAAPVIPNRRTSILSTFRSSIPEIPLVNQLLGRTSYSSIENEEEDIDEFDAYGQRPLNFQRPSTENLHAHAHFSNEKSESEEEFPLRRNDTGLHIRTQTSDTVPSFEDEDSVSTPSDTPSSPFQEIPHNHLQHEEPEIQSSWSPPRERDDGARDEVPMKPQASPMRDDFDPYNSATYLKRQDSGIEGFFNSVPQSSIKPKLDTSVNQGQNHNSPISANRLSIHNGDWPLPPSFPAHVNGIINASKTPANSPASAINPTSNGSGLFQRTRSFFEATPAKPSPTSPIKNARPGSGFFGTGSGNGIASSRGSISSISGRSRTDSLHQNEAFEEVIVPKSLDRDGKPPSPTFSLPPPVPPKSSSVPVFQNKGRRGTLMMARDRTAIGDGSFLDGLRMNGRESVGKVLGGLGDSIHNPNRASRLERQSLLNNTDHE